MKLKIKKDYYDEGIKMFATNEISFNPGVTILVGCNGYGKSTLISMIKNYCKSHNIELLQYDSEKINTVQRNYDYFLRTNQYDKFALLAFSSEGERLEQGFSSILPQVGAFVRKRKKDKKPFFITFDAVDSGLSIDEQIEYNKVFHMINEDIKGLDGYIIVTSNNYELTAGFDCMDVYNGSIVRFESYQDYKEFILKTKEIKNRRYEEDK
ncbi:AAA family ATPase [Massilimicrobiota timonensis]|uniref:AAA family ATPase n=1 Tax=Massilimicrobiota timonensis TaxID=1776392 RepID=UPI00101C0879|nr:AAA family ATPase [Massilimicrobiota timonensis]